MEREHLDLLGRRSLLKKVGATAVAGLAVGAAPACAQASPQSAGFEPARHDLDSWLGEMEGSHRVFVDSSTMPGGVNAMRFASNILTAHEEAYSGKVTDIAMVVCFRHSSTPYAFGDAIWAKYGAALNPSADPVPTSNPLNGSGQTSIGSLVGKGVHFAICARATRAVAGRLARAADVPTEDVLEELMAGAIPSSRFVPAGVMTVTRAQEYGYSLLYSE